MYRVVLSASMTPDRSSAFFGLLRHFLSCRAGLMMVCALLALTGCGPKNITSSNEPFVVQAPEKGYPAVSSGQKTGTVYLPSDDGRPLSPAEAEAFLSEGELDRHLSREDMGDVLLHFKYLVHQDRYTVEKNIERAECYMPFIYQTLRAKGLPRELAYIAFIESGYNPQATSRSGAAGMWQFIPSTGKHYGMTQDWWMDERRDPYQSTQAAADYLERLYKLFNDWHLAVTAYNAGEGKIQRATAAAGTKNFFELRRRNNRIYSERDRLSDENKQYLPKLLAVCKIMRNLDKLGFSRMDLTQATRVTQVRAKPGTDLKLFSQNLGLSWEEFVTHNPAYQRTVSHPSRSTKIYVPQSMAGKAQALLIKLPSVPAGTAYAGWKEYKVKSGDTMIAISRKTGVPVADLRRFNQKSEPLRAGSVLKIPGNNRGFSDTRLAMASPGRSASRPAPAAKRAEVAREVAVSRSAQAQGSPITHEVQKGDTMFSLAKRYGVTQEAILSANGMKGPDLRLGQNLRIPAGAATAVAARKSVPVRPVAAVVPRASRPAQDISDKVVRYTVQSGDTLWAIARKFNIPPMELLSLNNMSRNTPLRPGDTVKVAVN